MTSTHVPVPMTFTHALHSTGPRITFNNARVHENAQFKIPMHTDPTVPPPESVGRLQNLQNPRSPRNFELRALRPAMVPILSTPEFIPIPAHASRAIKDMKLAHDKAEEARFQRYQQTMALMLAFVCLILLLCILFSKRS